MLTQPQAWTLIGVFATTTIALVGLITGAFMKMVKAGFDSIEAKFEGIDARFDALDAKFDALDAKFGTLRN